MKIANCLYLVLAFSSTYSEFHFVSNKTEAGYLNPTFMESFVDVFHPDIFIETGTYSGETACNVAKFFKQVHTVELSFDLYEKAKIQLEDIANITVYYGNSAQFLQDIVPSCKGTILFWLDAHYSGGKTAFSNSDENCANAVTAIREELQAIAKTGVADCIILVDDMRGFGSTINGVEFLGCWAYPSIGHVCDLGRKINKNFEFVLLGDSLLMYDKTRYAPDFSPIVKACTISRLYDGSNYSENQLLEAERTIMQYVTPEERNFIISLYQSMTSYKDPLFHHDLWYACVCMGQGDWKEAETALMKVPERREYYNKNRQAVNTLRQYNPSRFEQYFAKIKANIPG